MRHKLDFHGLTKHCRTCDIPLKLTITRDIMRKNYCSKQCRAIDYHKYHDVRPPKSTADSNRKAGRTRSYKMRLGLIPKPPRPSPEASKRLGMKRRGSGNPRWIADRNKVKRCRFDASYRPLLVTWRNDIFVRDNYTCRVCNQHGERLNAHHIKPWAKYPESRYALTNGVTLCTTCHYDAHHGDERIAPTITK
jgi:hypothetical protein